MLLQDNLHDNSITIHECIWDIVKYILTKPNILINIYHYNDNELYIRVIDNNFVNTKTIHVFINTEYKDRIGYITQIIDVLSTISEEMPLQISVKNGSFDKQTMISMWDNELNLEIDIYNKTFQYPHNKSSSVELSYELLFTTANIDKAIFNYTCMEAKKDLQKCIYTSDDTMMDCLYNINPYGIAMTIDLNEPNHTSDDIATNICNEKRITLNILIDIDTGIITITITEHTPTIWDLPTMDITDNDKKILTVAHSLTNIGQDIIKDLADYDKYTRVVYNLSNLLNVIRDITYRDDE